MSSSRYFPRLIFCLSIAGIVFCATEICNASVECYRHTDCAKDLLCVNTVCTKSEEPLLECDTNGNCEYAICDEGFCKEDGVHCKDDIGKCLAERYYVQCFSDNGSLDVELDDSLGEEYWTDAKLYQSCGAALDEFGKHGQDAAANEDEDDNDDSGCSLSSPSRTRANVVSLIAAIIDFVFFH